MVVDHELVGTVLSSNDFRTGIPTVAIARIGRWAASEVFNPIEPPALLVTEPPDHTRYRRLVTRVFTARDHLSFSSGRHYCLGAQLAKMEGRGRPPIALRPVPGPLTPARRRPPRHPDPARL